MPSITEIIDSVCVPSLIKDEVIKNGVFEKSGDEPIYFSGGFTVVFPVSTPKEKWAFRCWHTEMGNVRDRFKIISDYINDLNSSYFCKFFYYDNGLVVDGKLFPTTRMKWVNGDTINDYLIKNSNNKEKLLSLAEKFLAMTEFLHKHHIAHGDLQHGNIIIENDDIKLVDYDSLFVPGLENHSDIITGKAEYQHPNRSKLMITSEKLDYFSELVIYLSILAIAYKPSIIRDFSIEDSLLFQSNDWNDFESSSINASLINIGNDDISVLTDILSDYLKEDNINNLRPFAEIWRNLQKEPIIHKFECGNVDGVVFRGIETLISWNVENIGRIFINSEEISCDINAHRMTFWEDTDITLVVKNGIHTIERRKHIKVLDVPEIKFSIDKQKLKKTPEGIESAILNWNVSKASYVELKCRGKILSTDISNSNYVIKPQTDSKYELIVTGLDNYTIFKSEVNVIICEPAKIVFNSDKLFTFPGIPITISWDVKGAKNVCLNNNAVGITGQASFSPKKDECYVLTFVDDFGASSAKLTVRMLPLPVIKSVLVDTPKINNVIGINYATPQFHEIPDLPLIKLNFVTLNVSRIPDLKDIGFISDLPESPKTKFSERMSHFLKSIFR